MCSRTKAPSLCAEVVTMEHTVADSIPFGTRRSTAYNIPRPALETPCRVQCLAQDRQRLTSESGTIAAAVSYAACKRVCPLLGPVCCICLLARCCTLRRTIKWFFCKGSVFSRWTQWSMQADGKKADGSLTQVPVSYIVVPRSAQYFRR